MFIKLTATDLTKWASYGACRVLKVFGNNPNVTGLGDDRYIQFHASPVVAASDVPAVASLYSPGGTGFAWGPGTLGEISLAELTIAISTTLASYTAPGAGTGIDCTVEIDTNSPIGPLTTLTGDTTTGVDERQAWATTANNKKRLVRMDFTNNSGATQYPVIQARNSSQSDGLGKALAPVTDGSTTSFFFGPGGGQFEETAADGTLYEGCLITYAQGISFPWNFSASTDCAIRLVHDTLS